MTTRHRSAISTTFDMTSGKDSSNESANQSGEEPGNQLTGGMTPGDTPLRPKLALLPATGGSIRG